MCNQILQRIVVGLTANPSVETEELLLYIHATINPYFEHARNARKKSLSALGKIDANGSEDEGEAIPGYMEDDDENDEDEIKPLYAKAVDDDENVEQYKPVLWAVDSATLAGQRSAYDMKKRQREELLKVEDGQNAPKLTGHGRHDRKRKLGISGMFADPAVHAAVKFGLDMLLAHLRKAKLDKYDHHGFLCFMLYHCFVAFQERPTTSCNVGSVHRYFSSHPRNVWRSRNHEFVAAVLECALTVEFALIRGIRITNRPANTQSDASKWRTCKYER